MERIIYFQDKSLLLSNVAPTSDYFVYQVEEYATLSRAKIVQFLENNNHVALITADVEALYAHLTTLFVEVVAAGGVVENERGEWLMIHRNDRWDLPKGHLEPNEELAVCAAREIEEETGVQAEVVAPICQTQHAYYFPPTERWELKTTHWYHLATVGRGRIMPQTEEGIDDVAWFDAEGVEKALQSTYPTIRCVVTALRQRNK